VDSHEPGGGSVDGARFLGHLAAPLFGVGTVSMAVESTPAQLPPAAARLAAVPT